MSRQRDKLPPRDLAAEIVRRVNGTADRPPYVIRLSKPPTPSERLQLIAARLQRASIVIMPHKCASVADWLERYDHMKDHRPGSD